MTAVALCLLAAAVVYSLACGLRVVVRRLDRAAEARIATTLGLTLDEAWAQNRALVAEWTARDDAAVAALLRRGAS